VKIAYVTMQFPVASEAFAAVEIRALRRLGAELTVLAYRAPPPRAAAMLAERELGDLPLDQGGRAAALRGLLLVARRPGDSGYLIGAILRHGWRRPLQLLKALALVPRSLALLQRVEVLRPDVLHLFWGHYPSLLGLLVKRKLPRTVVSLFLGAYDLEQRFPLSLVMARQADLLLTHARANLPALAALGLPPEQVEVSYRGIEVPAPPPAPQKTRGLMVVAERLVPQKRTADALRVFAAVAKAIPEARLRVLGDGPEAGALKALAGQLGIARQVTFAGHVAHHDVLRQLAEAEVALTLSQSRSERLPNALKEAMLQRCLCLATRTTGIEELIADGDSGLLVDFGDIAGAARRLTAALRDPGEVARIGGRAQTRIAADFDIDRLMAGRLRRWSEAAA
jgi:glycosyltransferase involved in cell wall biosynthesis